MPLSAQPVDDAGVEAHRRRRWAKAALFVSTSTDPSTGEGGPCPGVSRASAIAAPMPREAPVTSAVRP